MERILVDLKIESQPDYNANTDHFLTFFAIMTDGFEIEQLLQFSVRNVAAAASIFMAIEFMWGVWGPQGSSTFRHESRIEQKLSATIRAFILPQKSTERAQNFWI